MHFTRLRICGELLLLLLLLLLLFIVCECLFLFVCVCPFCASIRLLFVVCSRFAHLCV